MSLLNLLSNQFDLGWSDNGPMAGTSMINPLNYNISYGGPSKSIKYGDRKGEKKAPSYHLVDRVEWYGKNSGGAGEPHYNSNPTFLIGNDHKSVIPDFVFRGGEEVFLDRRSIDYQRINNFLFESDGVGTQFLIKQGALQLLNPRKETRTFNAGVSLLAQVAASGFSSIKRHGTIPEPAGININSSLGNVLGKIPGVGGFLSNAIGGDYLSSTGNSRTNEDFSSFSRNYSMGDPGAPKYKTTIGKIIDTVVDNPFKSRQSGKFDKELRNNDQKAYTQRWEDDYKGIDKINFQPVIPDLDNRLTLLKDLIPFEFEIEGHKNTNKNNIIRFRAFLDSWGDDFNASHNETKFNGRGESFYTYNKFKRSINISFKIAAQSVFEMKPIYQKLNYLAAQTAPGYSQNSGRIMTPYMRVTMGDYLTRVPGVLSNVGIQWQKDYPWEINNENSPYLKRLPHVLDVSISFLPIHDFVPNNDYKSSPFIGIKDVSPSGYNGVEDPLSDWLSVSPSEQDLMDKTGTYPLENTSNPFTNEDIQIISSYNTGDGYTFSFTNAEGEEVDRRGKLITN